MNSHLTSSTSNLKEPLIPESHPVIKDRRLFLSELISSDDYDLKRSFLSTSIVNSYDHITPARLDWIYYQLILMRFDKELIKKVLRDNARFLDYNFTREELLNRAIDFYLSQNEEAPIVGDSHFIPIEQEEEKQPVFYNGNKSFESRSDSWYSNGTAKYHQHNELEGGICRICYIPTEELITIEVCCHKFCQACVKAFIKSKVEHYDPKSIKCPNETCLIPLSEEFIAKILEDNQTLYQKYLKFKEQLDILDHPDRRWCIKPDCNQWVQKYPETNKTQCECGQEMCFECGNAWHEGLTCIEVMDKDYKKYEEEVIVKICPKCFSKIEKNEGCNHMTCSRCKHEFCWVCRAECINGYCINKCPKFPDNIGARRRGMAYPLHNIVFLQIKANDSIIVSFLKFLLNLLFFVIFSELLIWVTIFLYMRIWILAIVFSDNSLYNIMFENRENMNLSYKAKICHYLLCPIKFLLFLLLVVFSLAFNLCRSIVFVLTNQSKYIYYCWFDKSAFSLFIYERRIEFNNEDLYIIRGKYARCFCSFLAFALWIGYLFQYLFIVYTIINPIN